MNKIKHIACMSILIATIINSQSYAAKLKITDSKDSETKQEVNMEEKDEEKTLKTQKKDGLKIKSTSKGKEIVKREDKQSMDLVSKKNSVKTTEQAKTSTKESPVEKSIRKKSFPPINLNSPGVRISSNYGPRLAPTKGASSFHNGIDIAAPKGTLIKAVNDGVVVYAKSSGGNGNQITIDHGNGVKTIYKHMSKRAVNIGDKVLAGQIIGTVGNTGISTGPHLHFEVHFNGVKRNPLSIVNRK